MRSFLAIWLEEHIRECPRPSTMTPLQNEVEDVAWEDMASEIREIVKGEG